MRLLFDHGTLVLPDASSSELDWVPGVIWDDRVALLRAPAHRYAEIIYALASRGVPVDDQARSSGTAALGAFAALDLRPYQRAALLSWEIADRRGIIVLPTGSGKTRVAIAAIAGSGRRALCLVPTRALLEQWVAELARSYSGPIGRLGDGQRTIEDVTVSTFESAYRHMPALGKHFDLLIIDEVHHFGVGVRDEALEMSVASERLGLTATPPGGPSLLRLETLVGPIVHRSTIAELSGAWLSEFDLITVSLRLTPDESACYFRDYRRFAEVNREFRRYHPHGSWQEFVAVASQSPEGRAALAAWRRSRRLLNYTRAKADAVRLLLARHRDSKVLIFTADNDSAYAIARERLVMPITCDITRSERQQALALFRSGKLAALVSARVLNEGIDVPDANVAIVVGGTRGEREFVQRVGRLLRPVPGKRAAVYELVTIATNEPRRAAERRRGLALSTPVPL